MWQNIFYMMTGPFKPQVTMKWVFLFDNQKGDLIIVKRSFLKYLKYAVKLILYRFPQKNTEDEIREQIFNSLIHLQSQVSVVSVFLFVCYYWYFHLNLKFCIYLAYTQRFSDTNFIFPLYTATMCVKQSQCDTSVDFHF